MRMERVLCDHCGNDLSTTGNCEDYRLLLMSEPIPHCGGSVTTLAIMPPLQGRQHHFCGTECLAEFVKGGFKPR